MSSHDKCELCNLSNSSNISSLKPVNKKLVVSQDGIADICIVILHKVKSITLWMMCWHFAHGIMV